LAGDGAGDETSLRLEEVIDGRVQSDVGDDDWIFGSDDGRHAELDTTDRDRRESSLGESVRKAAVVAHLEGGEESRNGRVSFDVDSQFSAVSGGEVSGEGVQGALQGL
jgi:hypothetical protein